MNDIAARAREWLVRAYGDRVVLDSAEPLRETSRSVLLGCRHATADEPMLAATICVPTDGRDPFPVANATPLEEAVGRGDGDSWRWRANARGCVVAMDAVLDGAAASALPWRPGDESPGWWDRLLAGHFPDAEVSTCSTWAQVGAAVVDGGPGTRGVVWLRRHLDGRELTGHLLHVHHDEESGRALVVDPQLGTLATVADREVESLVLARFHRLPGAPVRPQWEERAVDFTAAVAKASAWLEHTYGGAARLVAPNPADELRRGWLFACTTTRFLETGDWRDQMLDAALMVPKAEGERPFGLPNRDPWTWLRDWDEGVTGLPAPPAPAEATWFGPLTEQIGSFHAETSHEHWAAAFEEIEGFPVDTLALIWLRRKDIRGRETVGHLLWARNLGREVEVMDPTVNATAPPGDLDTFELRVFRVRA
jgi:hypothetical protein